MKLINCTPHDITIVGVNEEKVFLPKTPEFEIKVSQTQIDVGVLDVDGVLILDQDMIFGELHIPENIPEEGILIVSVISKAALAASNHPLWVAGRVRSPGPAVRDPVTGAQLGAKGLVR